MLENERLKEIADRWTYAKEQPAPSVDERVRLLEFVVADILQWLRDRERERILSELNQDGDL